MHVKKGVLKGWHNRGVALPSTSQRSVSRADLKHKIGGLASVAPFGSGIAPHEVARKEHMQTTILV